MLAQRDSGGGFKIFLVLILGHCFKCLPSCSQMYTRVICITKKVWIPQLRDSLTAVKAIEMLHHVGMWSTKKYVAIQCVTHVKREGYGEDASLLKHYQCAILLAQKLLV